jgi:FixJ family two-component response regulator
MKRDMHIALVEDNRFHAILFSQAVSEHFPDSTVSVYATGKEFLDTLKYASFDLVAVDYNLPDTDGMQILSAVRAERTDVPVIMITGVGSEQTAVEAMKSGASDYIAKNGDYGSTIPRVIRQACKKQQLIAKNRRLEDKAREAEKLETITTMASTLNHEINNPLMAILGNVELLLEDNAQGDQGTVAKLNMIEKSARRIRDITHQMANLMTTSVRQTPAGPMLKLKGASETAETTARRPLAKSIHKSD